MNQRKAIAPILILEGLNNVVNRFSRVEFIKSLLKYEEEADGNRLAFVPSSAHREPYYVYRARMAREIYQNGQINLWEFFRRLQEEAETVDVEDYNRAAVEIGEVVHRI